MIKINDHEIEKRGISTFEVYWRDPKTGVRPFMCSFNDLLSAIEHVNSFLYYVATGSAPSSYFKKPKLVQLTFDF